MPSLKKNAIITGANRGIGLHLAEQLQEKGYDIYAICREKNDPIKVIAKQVLENIDLQKTTNIRKSKKTTIRS